MAYTSSQWEKAKEYFEAGLSLSDISSRTDISKPQISKKSKAEKWEKGNQKKQLIDGAVELLAKKETLKETALEVHNEIVNERTKHLLFFQNSALRNQKKANEALEDCGKMQDIESHSRLTKNNKETVLGKDIDTVISNQNTTSQPTQINIIRDK